MTAKQHAVEEPLPDHGGTWTAMTEPRDREYGDVWNELKDDCTRNELLNALKEIIWREGMSGIRWHGKCRNRSGQIGCTIERGRKHGRNLRVRWTTNVSGDTANAKEEIEDGTKPARKLKNGYVLIGRIGDNDGTQDAEVTGWLAKIIETMEERIERFRRMAPKSIQVRGYHSGRETDEFHIPALHGRDRVETFRGTDEYAKERLTELLNSAIEANRGAECEAWFGIHLGNGNQLMGRPVIEVAIGHGDNPCHRAPLRMSKEPPYRGWDESDTGQGFRDAASLAKHCIDMLREAGYR